MRYFIFVITSVLILNSCTSEVAEKIALQNTIDGTISGETVDSLITLNGNGIKQEFLVNNGAVNDSIILQKSGVYTFSINNKRYKTYIVVGEPIKFSATDNEFTFLGKQQVAYTYFQEKSEIMRTAFSPMNLYSLEPEAFIDSLNLGKQKLEDLLAKTKLPKDLASIEKEALEFNHKEQLYIYPLATDTSVDSLPAKFKHPLDGIDFQNEEKYLENSSYAKLVKTHFSIESNKDTIGTPQEKFLKAIAALPEGNIRNELLYGTMRHLLSPDEDLDELTAFFNAHSTSEEDKIKVKQTYNDLQVLMKGNTSPTFEYENYRGGSSKLSDFEGKYVYIDIWATWCAPCKAEIPFLKEKEEKYHNSNIEFVSISVDNMENYDTWKKMIADKELGGTQLIADKAWKSDFVSEYKIKGIPRFILLDTKGNIISANAPRPSSDELDELFNSLDLLKN